MNEANPSLRNDNFKTDDECCDLYDEYCYPCNDSPAATDEDLASDQPDDSEHTVDKPKS